MFLWLLVALYPPLFRNNSMCVRPQVDHLVLSIEQLYACVVRGSVTCFGSESEKLSFNKWFSSVGQGGLESLL